MIISRIPACIPAPAIKQPVVNALRGHPAVQDYLRDALGDAAAAAGNAADASAQKAAGTASLANSQNHSPLDTDLIDGLIERADIHNTSVTLTLAAPDQDQDGDPTQDLQHSEPTECITVLCVLGHAKPTQPLVIPSEGESSSTSLRLTGSQISNTSRLILTITRSQSWLAELRSGRIDSIQTLARRDGRSERNVRMMLNLAFLSPEMIAAIRDGSLPPMVNATDLAQGLLLDWVEQRRWIMGGAGQQS